MSNRKLKIQDLSIVCKAADSEQVNDKVQFGVKSFEIQILDANFDTEKIKKIFSDVDVVSVHSPVIYHDSGNWDELLISDLNESRTLDTFVRTCNLAQELAFEKKHRVVVVVHCDLSLSELTKFKLDFILKAFCHALDSFPDVEIGLENISPIRGNPMRFDNGWYMGPAEIAEYCNGLFNTDRIGSVLDICHMEMAQFLLDRYKDSEIYSLLANYNTEKDLEKYSATLKIIHLNEAVLDGYGSRHGVVASEDVIHRILKFFMETNKKFPHLCIEVKEKDYTKGINTRKTFENIKRVIASYDNG